MSEREYKFTVVMPIYNVEAYLAEAIDSVINQTIGFEENIRLILVNDGSSDGCEEICKKYLELYPDNVLYLKKENGGLSSARNFAFDHIKGRYVNFFDSDDRWSADAFEKAFDFFEKHREEVDVIVGRERMFDAKDRWHVLDYKYKKGTRIVDISDEEDCRSVQVHVISAFMKSEVLKDRRFDERVRFGEDGLFINPLLLEKMKYGIVEDCIYYYRKRTDKTSLTQIQKTDKAYYTSSPKFYYNGIIEASLERYGEVVPYIQSVLAYDIGWRVRAEVPEEIRRDRVLFAEYLIFLEKMMSYIDDEVFLRSPVHKRLGIKLDFYRLKHPDKELAGALSFDFKKKKVYAGDIRLYDFNRANHSACVIEKVKIEDSRVEVEGLVSKWLLSACKEKGLQFIIRSDERIYEPEIMPCSEICDVGIFGSNERYCRFSASLDEVNELKFAFTSGQKHCDVTVKYSEALKSENSDGIAYYDDRIVIGKNE